MANDKFLILAFSLAVTLPRPLAAAEPDPAALGPEVVVAPGDKPDVFADSKGNPHVVYEQGGIWHARGEGVTGRFSQPVRIAEAGSEPRLFLDEEDAVHVVWTIGTGPGGKEGRYANNVGGTWKAPLTALTKAEGGGNRVMLGRVLRAPRQNAAVAVFAVGDEAVLVKIRSIRDAPAVEARKKIGVWTPDIVPNPAKSGFLVASRVIGGALVHPYDFTLNPAGSPFGTMGPSSHGECASAFRAANGVCHYTGSGSDMNNARLWYTSDRRLQAGGVPACLKGMVVGDPDTSSEYWADVCADKNGRGYVTHNTMSDDKAYVAAVKGESLVSVVMAERYKKSLRNGPMCAPTGVGGIHVVYPTEAGVVYRTAGVAPRPEPRRP